MQELNHQEVEAVNGGVFINPWTVMIGVRAAQVAAPYAANFAYNAAAGFGAFLGYKWAAAE